LRQSTTSRDGFVHVAEGHRRVASPFGDRRDAHRRLGDYPQRSLRTQHERGNVGTGGPAGGGAAANDAAVRKHRLQPDEQVLDAPVPSRELSARARRYPATHGRKGKGLRLVAEHVAA
jgi:hypothetical protein